MAASFPKPGQPSEVDSGTEDLTSAPPSTPEAETQVSPQASPPPPAGDLPRNTYVRQPLSKEDERTWAMLAHLSILLNLVTGFLGLIAAILIYVAYRDRSRYVAYHALQSFVWQLLTWFGAGILAAIAWTISSILAVVLIGCLLMPFALLVTLIPLVGLVYGVLAAIQVNNGQDFRYPVVGDWVR